MEAVETLETTEAPEAVKIPASAARYSYGRRYNFGTDLNGFWRVPLRLMAEIQRKAPVKAGDRILDLGCGTGRLTEAFERACPGVIVTGTEIAESMAEVYQETFPHCRFVIGGLNGDISFAEDESYAMVASSGVFDHINLYEQPAFQRIMPKIKHGGHIAFTYERNWRASQDHEVRRELYNRYSDQVMKDFVEAAGAEVLHQAKMFGFIRTKGAGILNWEQAKRLKEWPDIKLPQAALYGIIIARKP